MQTRPERILSQIDRTRVDGVVLNAGPCLEYLIGLPFHLMERPILAFLVPDRPIALALPELEASRINGSSLDIKTFAYGEDPTTWADSIRDAVRFAGVESGRLAADSRWMRMLELDFLKSAAPAASVVADAPLFDALRLQKDAAELELIRRAVRIAESGLEATLPEIRTGVTERTVANILVSHLLSHGADPTLPFSPIVAFGENAANPHAEPSNREARRGDVVLVDWGAAYQGYFSDLTRVFCIGTPSDELAKVAEIVLRANRAGLAAGKPGGPAADVDIATRTVIEQAGYGDRFIHRTGHGLGMEVHEAPYIRGDSTDMLQTGMTFTIEPGIYLTGKFGVRIEDDVVVTDSGLESLSVMDRSLVRLEG